MSENLTFEQIGRRLKEAREAAGFTQTEVEEMVGINRVTVSNIERGKMKIDSLLLKRLADLYGYSLMYFLEEPEEHQKLTIAFRSDGLSEEEKEGINWAKKILFNYCYY
jgi:transcriptional regulator with XRE-family HTH domain